MEEGWNSKLCSIKNYTVLLNSVLGLDLILTKVS